MTPEQFAHNEYKDYVIYRELAKRETSPEFKRILNQLVEHEASDFDFWKKLSPQKEFHVGTLTVYKYLAMRKLLGLTFTAKFLERQEKQTAKGYEEFLKTIKGTALRDKVEKIVRHEREHERHLINHVKEERVQFTSSIILGLNDGLIELSGALVGFSFALQNTTFVALAGFITGVAASLSMASSAYMQARHESGKNPKKAGLYTGTSYFIVVLVLVAPYFIFSNIFLALGIMLGSVAAIIAVTSLYTSVLFDRRFGGQFREMLFFSAGVAAVTFVIGVLFRTLTWIMP